MKRTIITICLLVGTLLQSSCNKEKSNSTKTETLKTTPADSSAIKQSQKDNNVDIQSIVKTICSCEPISVFSDIYNNKVYYLTEEKTGEYDTLIIKLNIAEKIGNQWVKIKTQKIYSEDFVVVGNDETQYSTKVSINNKIYYFTPILLGHLGTANNGLNNYLFVFYNITGSEAPIIINYTRMDGEMVGEYEIITKDPKKKNLVLYKQFLKETNKHIDKVFGKVDEDINSPKNYISKWYIENNHIDLSEKGMEYQTTFLEYKTSKFFREWENIDGIELKENERFKILSGFKAPILAYDKKENKTLVLYVPIGLPNGCCWGIRSFYIKSFKNNIIVAESEDDAIQIDLINEKIKVIEK